MVSDNFEAAYGELLEKVAQNNTEATKSINADFLAGKIDAIIMAEKVSKQAEHFGRVIGVLQTEKKRFEDILKPSDAEIYKARLHRPLPNLSDEENELRKLSRTLTQERYFGAVFRDAIHEDTQDLIASVDTSLTPARLLQTQFALSPLKTENDEETALAVRDAHKYIGEVLGQGYSVHKSLTAEETLGLEERLRTFADCSKKEKAAFLCRHLDGYLPNYDNLTVQEKAAYKRARKKLREFSDDELPNLRSDFMERLAGIILCATDSRRIQNSEFRTIVREWTPSLTGNNLMPLVAEDYMTQQILPHRNTLLGGALREAFDSTIDTYRRAREVLSKEDLDALDLGEEIRVMRSMRDQYDEKGRLTAKQRKYGTACLDTAQAQLAVLSESELEAMARVELKELPRISPSSTTIQTEISGHDLYKRLESTFQSERMVEEFRDYVKNQYSGDEHVTPYSMFKKVVLTRLSDKGIFPSEERRRLEGEETRPGVRLAFSATEKYIATLSETQRKMFLE